MVFCFKQKTAYEMRISDWSSYVCSSDLTTLKTLCGVIPATSGTKEFEGRNLTGSTTYDVVASGISMIPEGRQLFPNFTVRDNLIMGSFKRTARPIVQQKMDEVLQIFPRVKERLNQLDRKSVV